MASSSIVFPYFFKCEIAAVSLSVVSVVSRPPPLPSSSSASPPPPAAYAPIVFPLPLLLVVLLDLDAVLTLMHCSAFRFLFGDREALATCAAAAALVFFVVVVLVVFRLTDLLSCFSTKVLPGLSLTDGVFVFVFVFVFPADGSDAAATLPLRRTMIFKYLRRYFKSRRIDFTLVNFLTRSIKYDDLFNLERKKL